MVFKEFSEINLKNLEISGCDKSLVNDFVQLVNKETIGTKVNIALSQRHQGHFDKAMLNISEVNRDQVIAIREIQLILDRLAGRNKTEVILKKYRQVFPFQIGLTNAKEVLDLLNLIKSCFDEDYAMTINELFINEKKRVSLLEEYNFFSERMRGKIPESELEDMQIKLSDLSAEIISYKESIINNIIGALEQKQIETNINDKLKLIMNFYLILTSSIETLDAKLLDV